MGGDPAETGIIVTLLTAIVVTAGTIIVARLRRGNDKAEEGDSNASRDERYGRLGLDSLSKALDRAELENTNVRAELAGVKKEMADQALRHATEIQELRSTHNRELTELRDAIVRLGGTVERSQQ